MLPPRSVLLLVFACGSSTAISYGCYRILPPNTGKVDAALGDLNASEGGTAAVAEQSGGAESTPQNPSPDQDNNQGSAETGSSEGLSSSSGTATNPNTTTGQGNSSSGESSPATGGNASPSAPSSTTTPSQSGASS